LFDAHETLTWHVHNECTYNDFIHAQPVRPLIIYAFEDTPYSDIKTINSLFSAASPHLLR